MIGFYITFLTFDSFQKKVDKEISKILLNL
jgi:hypothetical protein